MKRSKLVVSIGCPCGIGPEVSIVSAFASRDRVLLVGDYGAIVRAAKHRELDVPRIRVVDSPEDAFARGRTTIDVWQPLSNLDAADRVSGAPTARSGEAQLRFIDAACDLVKNGVGDALVTGPVSKDAIVRSRVKGSEGFIGHTEHIQRRLGAREVVMAFWSTRFTTALATTHWALRDVPRILTRAEVSRAAYWLARSLATLEPRRKTIRIGVCGLNPHAGENGLLGSEERTVIAPGLALARRRLAASGIRAELVGPTAAETVFRHAQSGLLQGVLAMYHDQATIPVKLLGFGDAVNVSLGLPIVRTSVDHGTAYDRAARFDADCAGMSLALDLAARLCR